MPRPSLAGVTPQRLVRVAGRQVLSVGVLGAVGALVVATSLPAQALPNSGPSSAAAASVVDDGRSQSVRVAASATEASVARDTYQTTDLIAQAAAAKAKAAAKVASSGSSSAGEPSTSGVAFIGAPGPVLWPTDVSPKIGNGVTNAHRGQDLLMAGGTPVHAIADGVVITSAVQGSYGQYVVIQSTVGGHTVTSLYAHMQLGSSPVSARQLVTQGQTIGLVGSTGAATANLLYLRIIQDGTLVDTITYIKANPAGGAAPQ